ncbi:SagB family peptide dehydrogenase [Streptomyces iconiensis]|uniref:SagB family peptide dehydrogenase n=1 Tax=Streptomyces iconiensis TaxID=1384038 RepID=A0ABT6ZX83_9ACTN|nr:SagB family peptide dehydrogenase [Streptomyces iconiensis]MDJ1133688.1 SagB family peptide dehydrogenase [Streptomyces iconiensis]
MAKVIEMVGAEDGTLSWRSLHVAADDDETAVERLLSAAVAPWAADTTAASWFLERAGKAGDELRVHVLEADGRDMSALREAIRSAGWPGKGGSPAAVSEFPYEPDTARFGGADGFAVCARHFGDAARTALAAIRSSPSREQRLRAAASLLLASALAVAPEPKDAVQWLRGHASSLARVTDVAAARSRAEEDHFRNEAEWRHRHAATRARLTRPTTTVGAWHQLQCAVRTSLARLEEAGRLCLATADVHRALSGLLCEQLGLDAQDTAYTAWLVSMDLVSPGPREPYFADSPAACDRLLHENGKFFGARLMDQRPDMAGATQEGRQELPAALARFALTRPGGPAPEAPGFEEVLLARRSTYGTYEGPFSVEELSALLYFSAGVTAEKTMPGADSSYPVRPYPSGGTRYPLRTLLYCHDIAGLARGVHLYDPLEHALDQLDDRDISAELMRMAPATDPRVAFPPKAGGKLHVDACPLWVFTVADLTFQRLHYGLRSYRLVLQESGHLAQNLALVGTWLGKSSVGIGGFYDDTVNEVLALDGVNSSVVYVHLVGVVRPPRADGTVAHV